MEPPSSSREWIGLSPDPLPVDEALRWSVEPGCGAQVVFTGTVRDSAGDHNDVVALEYEAWLEEAEPRLRAVAVDARLRWPEIGRVVLLHRIGRLTLSEVAVVVVVAAPHRPEAFAAARFCIDRLKATVPIWKKETWADGESWAEGAQPIESARP